jgi:uncharacterized protein
MNSNPRPLADKKVHNLVLQATPYCNLNCSYCYLPDRKNRSRMDPKLAADAIRFLAKEQRLGDKVEILWHAGEPLAAGLKFYQEATNQIRQALPVGCGVSFAVQTNGTLVNDAWAQFFSENQYSVGLSLDGPQEIHDAHRKYDSGKGSFALTIRGLETLQRHGLVSAVIAVVTQESMKNPDLLYDFFEPLNIKILCLNIEEEEGINRSKTIRAAGFAEDYRRFIARMYERQEQGSLKIREVDRITGRIFSTDPVYNVLADPLQYFCIDYQGNFSTFCPELLGFQHQRYGSFALGNIYSSSLDEVFLSTSFQKIYGDICNGIEKCRQTCEYFFLCGGGHPVNKLYENGSFDSTETQYCRSRVQIPVQVILPKLEEAEQRRAAQTHAHSGG